MKSESKSTPRGERVAAALIQRLSYAVSL